jgi:CheY-like chemotaxis protein
MNRLKRILLVEDQSRDVELTLAALEEYHLANEVAVARDGVEALDYLYCRGKFAGRSDGNPAVILLDIKMPRLNGLEVLREIKSDPNLKFVPVVMLTSSREEPDLKKSYELGVTAYVVKPVDFQQFTDAVKHIGVFWAVLNELPAVQLEKSASA